jgi:hypothetical protein
VNVPRLQHGSTISPGYILGVLIMLAIAGRFAWWVATEENFAELAAILWAVGFGIAYFITLGDLFVARMPAGFAVFALLSLAGLPLSWMSESRIAVIVVIGAQLASSVHAGRLISGRLRAWMLSRYPAGGEPAWLRQKGDVVADFGRWALYAGGAFFYFSVAPLLILLLVSLFIDVSQQQVKWAVVLWGIAGISWFGLKTGATRWRRIPACAWIYLGVTATLLAVDAVAGPFAADTGAQAVYIALPGALIAAFVEVFVLGGGSKITKEEETR